MPTMPYFQVSENGAYPASNCPPNPGNLPNRELEVDDGSFISDTLSSEVWLRMYCRGWDGYTEEPIKNLENAPEIVNEAHKKYLASRNLNH